MYKSKSKRFSPNTDTVIEIFFSPKGVGFCSLWNRFKKGSNSTVISDEILNRRNILFSFAYFQSISALPNYIKIGGYLWNIRFPRKLRKGKRTILSK